MQHPNITRVIDVLEDETHFFIVMEVVIEGNLLEYTNERKDMLIQEREGMA